MCCGDILIWPEVEEEEGAHLGRCSVTGRGLVAPLESSRPTGFPVRRRAPLLKGGRVVVGVVLGMALSLGTVHAEHLYPQGEDQADQPCKYRADGEPYGCSAEEAVKEEIRAASRKNDRELLKGKGLRVEARDRGVTSAHERDEKAGDRELRR